MSKETKTYVEKPEVQKVMSQELSKAGKFNSIMYDTQASGSGSSANQKQEKSHNAVKGTLASVGVGAKEGVKNTIFNGKAFVQTDLGAGKATGLQTAERAVREGVDYDTFMQEMRDKYGSLQTFWPIRMSQDERDMYASLLQKRKLGLTDVASLESAQAEQTSKQAKIDSERLERSMKSQAALRAVDEKYELGKVGEAAQELGAAAGQMLPSLAAGVVNPGLGLATMAGQAALQGYGQALDEGASHEEATRYGVASGMKEAAIERMTGGLGRFYGKGVLDKAIRMQANDSAKHVLANTAKGMLGEGAEEAVSGFLDPFIQRATYNPSAENATAGELAHQAAIGAALGGILGGGSNVLEYGVNRGRNTIESGNNGSSIVKNAKNTTKASENDGLAVNNAKNTIENRQIGVDSEGQKVVVRRAPTDEDMQTITPHIDERDYRSVGSRKIKAFSYEHPEVRPFYVTEAERMKRELQEAEKPSLYFGRDETSGLVSDTVVGGHGRIASEDIAFARDELGMSYAQIEKALDDIIEDSGRENSAGAKRMEILFDNVLSMGEESDAGYRPPSAEYVKVKHGIAGARDYGYGEAKGRYENGEYDPINDDPYALQKQVWALAERKGHELTADEETELQILQDAIDSDREAFSSEQIESLIDNLVQGWAADNPAKSPYEQAMDSMLKGEDGTKSAKVESEDDRAAKRFIQSAAVNARLGVEYRDMPLNQKAHYKDGKIYINQNRSLSEGMKSTVAHEIYHALEGSKEHDKIVELALKNVGEGAIQEKIAKYGEYGIRLDENGARAEIGADFIERALTDEATINEVLLENRTLASRILERIKDMIAVYKAKKNGMSEKEAEEYKALLRARRLYEDGLHKLHEGVYEPAGGERNARYQAIKRTDDGRNYVEVEDDFLAGVPKKDWGKVAMQNLAKKFPNGVQIGNNLIKINADSRNELQNSKYTQQLRKDTVSDKYHDKMSVTNNADELLQSNRDYVNEDLKHERKDNIKSFGRGKILFKVGDNTYSADMVVGNKANGSMILYDIVNMQPEKFNEKRDSVSEDYSSSDADTAISTNNIPNSIENVNSKSVENEKRFSIDESVNPQTETPEFKQWFGDSKVVDENGKPKVVYHGTGNDFAEFKRGDIGFHFGSKEQANDRIGESDNARVMPVYLSIKNPLEIGTDYGDWNAANVAGMLIETEVFEDHPRQREIENRLEEILAIDSAKGKESAIQRRNRELRELLQSLGYDGIVYENTFEGDKYSGDNVSYIAFEPTQVKSAIGNRGTFDATKADIRYSIDDSALDSQGSGTSGDSSGRYEELINRYGRIEPGMEPREDVAVPKQANDWNRVRRFTRTAMESENINSEAKSGIAEKLTGDVRDGRFVYEPISNKSLQEKANANIAKAGYDKSKKSIFAKYQTNEKITAEDVATLEQLIVKAADEGNSADVLDMVGLASMIGTEMGQSVQALSMLKRMTPEGRLRQMELLRDRLNSKHELSGAKEVQINKRYADMLLDKKNSSEDADTIQSYIIDDMAKQLPTGLKDKFDAWRYLAMLGNPRTHMRNIIGNVLNLSVSRINDQLAGAVESIAVKSGERTKAVGAVSKELKEFAKADWEENGRKRTDLGNKYGERGQAERNRQVFTSKVMQPIEKARKFNESAMDAEDTFFKEKQYIYALSHYMKANHLTPEIMRIENSPVAERARKYAEDEAYRVTFQEYNSLASALNRFENKKAKNKGEKVAQLGVSALMPFKKTPLNILKRGVEYSPVGLANGISDALTKVRKGDMPATEAINEITQGLTGTGVVILGYFLAEMGLITAGYDEGNKREQNYTNQLGGQNYALTVPGIGSYSLDWAAPAVMPLFVGAALYDDIASRDEGESVGLKDIGNALVKVTDPVLEMSCMDSLQSALESYGNEGAFSNMITSAATSYLMQFVPTLSGQIARTIDDTKRSTYAPSDSRFTKTGESLGRQFANKVPGLSFESEAAIDVWGRERKQSGDNIASRAALNMLSPGNYAADKETATDKELKRLYEASGESGVLPKMGSKYITYKADGEKSKTYYLTAKEYTKYQTKYGQDNFKAVSELVRSNVYKSMSDEDKAKAVKEIYTYNGQMANKEFFQGRKVSYDNGAEMTEKLKDAGGWANYFEVKNAFPDSSYESAKKRKEKCDKYGIDYTAYAESSEKISDLKSANTAKFKEMEAEGKKVKSSDKTEANKRAIAKYLAGRKDLTNPQKQVIWQEYYSGKSSESYISVARRCGFI